MDWSPQQDRAVLAACKWLRTPSAPQVFRLFGYAGTGKTTLAKEIAAAASGKVLFAAFTGKAASVLRKKGCDDAATIHSLIYRVEEDFADEIDDEDESTAKTPAKAKAPAGSGIRFLLNEDSPVAAAKLVIVDEVSMVGESLGRDLLWFGKKVLVLGDPAQLPPVEGTGFFTDGTPDEMLTEVHRQAKDNPIIRLSMQAREGKKLERMRNDRVSIVRARDPDADGQTLVGRNATRRDLNRTLREEQGFESPYPEVGDRVVCLKNDSYKGLLNGTLWNVEASSVNAANYADMTIRSEDAPGCTADVSVPCQFFEGREQEIDARDRSRVDQFDYGYALTVHKSQGSQWDSVVLHDESWCFREHRNRWLYTGITRAAERLTVVQG